MDDTTIRISRELHRRAIRSAMISLTKELGRPVRIKELFEYLIELGINKVDDQRSGQDYR